MGSASINRVATLELSPGAIRVEYSVDFAEGPAQAELRRQEGRAPPREEPGRGALILAASLAVVLLGGGVLVGLRRRRRP
jgi:hypothetical protein